MARHPVAFRPVHRTRSLQVLEKQHFVIGYDNQAKNPAWVTYDLDGPIAFPGQEPTRPATFETDFATSAHVSQRDYTSSGYDRGHMCPAYAEWSRYGVEAFKQTFICSNIIPQLHSVNAGIWEDLEVEIAGRSGHGGGWAERFGHLTIINGPVYDQQPEHLRAGITVPTACFSIVIDWQEDGSGYRALAFEIPNKADTQGPLTRYLTSIKAVEASTGLDVFAGEAEAYRASLETARADRLWSP
jgi:endonuclease G